VLTYIAPTLCVPDRLEMFWRVRMQLFQTRADRGTRDCVAGIHASVQSVARRGGVGLELKGELRSLEKLSCLD